MALLWSFFVHLTNRGADYYIRENVYLKEAVAMPMYEYQCSCCNHNFELRQKFSDPPASECPECGGEVRKMISQSAFSLKGGGWFNSGYCPKTELPKPESCAASGCCCA